MSSSTAFKVKITEDPPFWPRLPKKWAHGLTGCFYGNLAVCSPNSERMFIPLVGHERRTLLRQDFRFGTDDPICHPQLYNKGMLFLACMRAPSLQDDINYLFRPFHNSWWIVCPGITELGRLDPTIRRELVRKSKAYVSSLDDIKDAITRGQYKTIKSVNEVFTPHVVKVANALQYAWTSIGGPGTLNDLRLRYVNLQRQELMLRGLIDEATKFRSCFFVSGNDYRETSNHYIGAQTTNINTALSLYNTGLPVWYICEAKHVDPSKFKHFLSEAEVERMRTITEIPPIEYQMGQYDCAPNLEFLTGGRQPFITRIPTPKAVVIWQGEAGDPARYTQMSAVLGKHICGWETEEIRATLASSPSRQVEPEFTLPPSSSNTPPASNSNAPLPPLLTSSTSSTSVATASSSMSISENRKRAADSTLPGRPPERKKSRHPAPKKASNPTAEPTRNRWVKAESELLPEPLPTWLDRLEFVGKELKFNGREQLKYPGITKAHTWSMLPEAAMLANIKRERTRALYLNNLCRVFSFLEYNVESAYEDLLRKAESTFISPRQWRILLATSENDGKQGETASAGRRKEMEDLLANMVRSAGGARLANARVNIKKLMSQPVIWLDNELAPGFDPDVLPIPEPVHPPTHVVREIMWYLIEGNFRIELFTLDSALYDAGRSSVSLSRSPRNRARFVRETLSWSGHFALPGWGDHNKFCAEDVDARWKAVRLLAAVMMDWQRDPKCMLSSAVVDIGDDLEERMTAGTAPVEDIIKYEEIIFEHYIRCYAYVFARAPTIPCKFPSPVVKPAELVSQQ
ncbi:hypothetical protein CYLTODRAFT_444276 [Cylindrobasidium torrendii FP15055 ss-10]|uniref:Uncharacterized protein n=1 Tax=Cylindrobasidium torrendii FP15055 ss-10 TaxID=1314674 RepID=A0A0D7BC55_9AGAR|nr:hypothetical protein CYLTODRAFT_444276 [Cylindrobasidium torrendii FP15055 ss-10]